MNLDGILEHRGIALELLHKEKLICSPASDITVAEASKSMITRTISNKDCRIDSFQIQQFWRWRHIYSCGVVEVTISAESYSSDSEE